MIALPLSEPALNAIVALPLPGVAISAVGADGVVAAGVTGFDAVEAAVCHESRFACA